jgi:hypothetical protein
MSYRFAISTQTASPFIISLAQNPPTPTVHPPSAFHCDDFAIHDFLSSVLSALGQAQEEGLAKEDAFRCPSALRPLSRQEAQSLVMFQSAPVQTASPFCILHSAFCISKNGP